VGETYHEGERNVEINADVVGEDMETTDYYQVEPIPPQPDSITTHTKRTPRIYHSKGWQCWKRLKTHIEMGGLLWSKPGLLKEMDTIEKQVRND
jgi:hypothetical protein